eukprot:TRINITY_DN1333_c0_g1_i2.p1 TRINITY_DN1333_c0_g1~~TRINITY_DN1333_c0_g1_i2.p1  ORF type:complete len:358 (+),score=70.13 TRINITY_DN1333_c0_g1_i2:151-1224(+)
MWLLTLFAGALTALVCALAFLSVVDTLLVSAPPYSPLYFVTRARLSLLSLTYVHAVRPLLFSIDPERIHDIAIWCGSLLSGSRVLCYLVRISLGAPTSCLPSLSQRITFRSLSGAPLHCTLESPVALAAGFDKNARLAPVLLALGFGALECGSITGSPCHGNALRPRLWRVPQYSALQVFYGMPNDGCEQVRERVRLYAPLTPRPGQMAIGCSVARTNVAACASLEAGVADFSKAFNSLYDCAQYLTINASCPNVEGSSFCSSHEIDALLRAIFLSRREENLPCEKPVFIKISPDIEEQELKDIVEIACSYPEISGFVCTNLTKNKAPIDLQNELAPLAMPSRPGGLSGGVRYCAFD